MPALALLRYLRDARVLAGIGVLIASATITATLVASTGGGGSGGTASSATTTTVTPSTTTTPPPTTGTSTTTTAPAPTTTTTTAPQPTSTRPSGRQCVVRLHGKGGSGGPTWDVEGVRYLSPNGNASGWGGRQWLYFADNNYTQARSVIASAIDTGGCGQVIIDGFSNGAAFAAKLYCRGETFGGRVIGVVVDDPVPDHAVEQCAPTGGVRVTLYWTGALTIARPGWNCAEQDWTCEGGTTIGIDAYQSSLRTTRKQSPNSDHFWYDRAPEITAFI